VGDSLDRLDSYNYVLGTQTIGARYSFTDKPVLIETAEVIRDMGSNILKICMSRPEGRGTNDRIETLVDLADRDPTYRTLFDMPFAYYHVWANCFTPSTGWTVPGFGDRDAKAEYDELRDLSEHLLRTYSGTGKTFYLGHWEGDWLLLQRNFDLEAEPTDEAIRLMIDGLNLRQKAVDDAKAAVTHSDVEVYNYTEVNQVQKSLRGKKSLAMNVLPEVDVDFVSYSAYDSTNRVLENPDEMTRALHEALDFVEERMKPKAISGKRVWIGEYGLPLEATGTPERQGKLCSAIARAGLEWGTLFILYWEMYNNEVVVDRHRGFWMIDNHGEKQPIYYIHKDYYKRARDYLRRKAEAGRPRPDHLEFCTEAATLLDHA
jgi:hypothetical protein